MAPKKSNNHITPLNTSHTPKIHAAGTCLPSPLHPDFLTTALHRDWEKAYYWAVQNGITDQFFRAIATCHIWDKPNLLGSLLAQITSPLEQSHISSEEGDKVLARIFHTTPIFNAHVMNRLRRVVNGSELHEF